MLCYLSFFFFSSRRRHTRLVSDWSSDVCSSDLRPARARPARPRPPLRAQSVRVTARGRPSAHRLCTDGAARGRSGRDDLEAQGESDGDVVVVERGVREDRKGGGEGRGGGGGEER